MRASVPLPAVSMLLLLALGGAALANPSKDQLARWLKQYPKADEMRDSTT